MITTQSPALRRAGAACLAGAGLTLVACAVVAYAQSSTDESSHLFRWPFARHDFVAFSLFTALTHLLILIGMIGLSQSGIAGTSRLARLGLRAVVGGTALLFACEFASIPLLGERNGATVSVVVDACFGFASLLVTFGMIAVGRATLRDGQWASWRRYAPLACGLLSLVVIPLQVTSAIWVGVATYAIGYGVVGAALATDPTDIREPSLQVA